MRSFISLHKENWRSHSYAAARCVGDQVLFQMLKANSNIDTVYLCMDNDVAGQAANKRIADRTAISGTVSRAPASKKFAGALSLCQQFYSES